MYPITKGDILKVRVITTNILVVEHLIKQTFNFVFGSKKTKGSRLAKVTDREEP
jgi:hypothetical protein